MGNRSSVRLFRQRISQTAIGRAVVDALVAVGGQLPPAAELAEALDVDRNTVFAAYRVLREDGVLEFRRGRGPRIAAAGCAGWRSDC